MSPSFLNLRLASIVCGLLISGCDRVSKVIPVSLERDSAQEAQVAPPENTEKLEAADNALARQTVVHNVKQGLAAPAIWSAIQTNSTQNTTGPASETPACTGVVKQITELLDKEKTEAARTLLIANDVRLAGDAMFQLQYARWLAMTCDIIADTTTQSDETAQEVETLRQKYQAAIEFDENISSYAAKIMVRATMNNLRKRAKAGQPLLRCANDDNWSIVAFPGPWANDLQTYMSESEEAKIIVKQEMRGLVGPLYDDGSVLSSLFAISLSADPGAITVKEGQIQSMNYRTIAAVSTGDELLKQLNLVAAACRRGEVVPTTFVTAMIMIEDLLGNEFSRHVGERDPRVMAVIDSLVETVVNEDRLRLGNWLNNLSWEFCKRREETPERLELAEELIRKSLALLPKVELESAEKEQGASFMQALIFGDFSRAQLYSLYSRALNTQGVAEMRSGKTTEAIQHFERAIAFYEALESVRRFAELGGETFSGDERYFNHVCIVLCRIDQQNDEAARKLLEAIPAPESTEGDYATFYAEAKSRLEE